MKACLAIYIFNTSLCLSINKQISRVKKAADLNEVLRRWLAENAVPTRELSAETIERVLKLILKGNSAQSVAKDVGCFQSAVSKLWSKCKQNGRVRPKKMSKSTAQKTESNMPRK